MNYRFKTGEDLPAGIRRIAREQLEDALALIATASAGEAAAVHETRKDIKKIRALLRLIRKKIGPEIFKEENDRLREVARGFSGTRDARVQRELLEKLRGQAPRGSTHFAETTAVLEQEIARHAESFGSQRRAAKITLQSIGDRLEGWPLEKLTIEDLSCALRSSYRLGRKSFRCVRAEPTAKNFHSWRKRVKEIWYQSRLLQNLNPAVMSEIIRDIRTLGQRLGDLHDLAFFRIHLEAEPGGAEEERTVLLGLICPRERALEEMTLDLGARFFPEKPGAFERRLLRDARA